MIPKIGFVSLGCPKALSDTEVILSRLRAEGYLISPEYRTADLIIINTCGFIEDAVDESFDAIAEALSENGRVIVTGCLGKRAEFVKAHFPELLGVTGPADIAGVLALVHQYAPKPHDPMLDLIPPQGIRLTPPHFAYLKISEGCSHACRFCIIPQLRGPLVSRSFSDIMREAEALVAGGVQELLVVAQDTGAYGRDLSVLTSFWEGKPVKTRIETLVDALSTLGVWVRLHYLYPYPTLDRLVERMQDGRILPYLDMPLQHASIPVLKAMRRPAATEDMLRRIESWRDICPDIAIRSTFITGFPGETEQDFETLLSFLKEARLDRVGCFTYSPVEGAAANQLPNPVDFEVAEARRQALMALQAEISRQKLKEKVGQTIPVIIDGIDDDEQTLIGRTIYDAPDIDGIVRIQDDMELLSTGDRVPVTITDTDEHDLYGVYTGQED